MADVTIEKPTGRVHWLLPTATAGGCAFLVNLLASNDWCFGALTALSVAAAASAALDGATTFLTKGRVNQVFRLALGVLVGSIAGLAIRLTDAKAFQVVFETDPPKGVKGVLAERWYVGGPGDQILLMQFRTDAAGLEPLRSRRGLNPDADVIRLWSEVFKERKSVWEHVFGGLLPEDNRWHRVAAPTDPIVYCSGNGITPNIIVLWDLDAGVAYVMYSVG